MHDGLLFISQIKQKTYKQYQKQKLIRVMLLPIYNIQLFNTYEMATLILQRANPFPYFFCMS